MKVYISERRRVKVLLLVRDLLLLAQKNNCWVSLEKRRHFCGVVVYPNLALLLIRFYTRFLYFDMVQTGHEEGGTSTKGGAAASATSPP